MIMMMMMMMMMTMTITTMTTMTTTTTKSDFFSGLFLSSSVLKCMFASIFVNCQAVSFSLHAGFGVCSFFSHYLGDTYVFVCLSVTALPPVPITLWLQLWYQYKVLEVTHLLLSACCIQTYVACAENNHYCHILSARCLVDVTIEETMKD